MKKAENVKVFFCHHVPLVPICSATYLANHGDNERISLLPLSCCARQACVCCLTMSDVFMASKASVGKSRMFGERFAARRNKRR